MSFIGIQKYILAWPAILSHTLREIFSFSVKETEKAAVYVSEQTQKTNMRQNNMLGKDGLTITSANHLANIAKEMYESLVSRLSSLRFYSRDYMLAIAGKTFRVENESEKSELETLTAGLREIGELKSLIAYLREGIKAKNQLDSDSAFDEHVEELIKAGRKDLEKPKAKQEVTFEDEFAKLTEEQKARYFSLEAKCATIGSFIHPDGDFAKARKAFFEHTKDPIKVVGKGQEAEINTYSSSFTAEDVDAVFFELQKEHRRLQAEFNKLKAEVDEKVADANKAIANDTLASMKLWVDARKVERNQYDADVKALKVVVPQNLREVYERVNAVANAK